MKIKFLFFILLFVLSGCTNQVKDDNINQDLRMRINILYEHTIMMKELSSNEKMLELGINASDLSRNGLLLPEQKIIILEKSYNIKGNESYETRVEVLEDKMNEIMLKWGN